jgi:hypothetical protein
MATIKTLLSNLNSLLCNDIISDAEHTRIQKRILKAEAQAAEAQVVADLVPALESFMTAGTQYKISDLVLGVLGIKAPCHGITETPEQRKFRDGTAKPRIIAALDLLGATKTGSGAQTRYSFGETAPEFEVNAETEEESAES